jgi:acetyl esterase/lipase
MRQLKQPRYLVRAIGAFIVALVCAGVSNRLTEASRQRGEPAKPALMTPADPQSLPMLPADHRLTYGDDPNQFGELRLPGESGPHPVVVLLHGGCWKAEYATLRDLAPIGDALKANGIASWNVEYRRLRQPRSGWPGTYVDVARAIPSDKSEHSIAST